MSIKEAARELQKTYCMASPKKSVSSSKLQSHKKSVGKDGGVRYPHRDHVEEVFSLDSYQAIRKTPKYNRKQPPFISLCHVLVSLFLSLEERAENNLEQHRSPGFF